MADSSKLTGRPKMGEQKRTRKIDVRFTQEEFETISALEQSLGMSKTDLVRMRLLHDAKKVVINAKDLVYALDNIGTELARAGNNINQLARHANILKLRGALSPVVVTEFVSALLSYTALQRELEKALRRIIREMAN